MWLEVHKMKSKLSNNIIISYMGIFLIIIGIVNLIPLLVLVAYPEEFIYVKSLSQEYFP